ncbi:hypothetical protein GW17_00045792 [Ensete ventricosum]|nr:hypothetical protein GW17_00045792 [Ensete ventricosum]
MAKVEELVGGWEKKSPHVDREKVGAVTTPHGDRLEEAGVGNTHLPRTRKQDGDNREWTGSGAQNQS